MNSDIAIKVENISKCYQLTQNIGGGYDSLLGSTFRGLKRTFSTKSASKQKEEFWALQALNFEVKRGDRIGIIGHNGAGKSTLLKILSRIVKPSTGRITYEGRLASLLEVGTGFHGDLTGRENIYLNGSILGMTKREIDSKFDEIVAFSEVEQFLDTPVKRYSSGMYVRLAFSVAAHLDPDILIVDEVLAVGDAAFQKKSIGKMEASSQNDGKTILFVSHNIGQISAFCNKGILLKQGRIIEEGALGGIINTYFGTDTTKEKAEFIYENTGEKTYCIERVRVLNTQNALTKNFAHTESIRLAIDIKRKRPVSDVLVSVFFSDMLDKRLFTTQVPINDKFGNTDSLALQLTLPSHLLTANTYFFTVALHVPNVQVLDEHRNLSTLSVFDNGSDYYKYQGIDMGYFFMDGAQWEVKH